MRLNSRYMVRGAMVFLSMVFGVVQTMAADDVLLKGTPIGSSPSVDYSNNSATTTKNVPADAFDGSLETFYASYGRSYTWVGLDLGTPHVITRVGWAPRNDGNGPRRVVLGVFEGSNSPDFMDALPLYVVDEQGVIGQMSYADVTMVSAMCAMWVLQRRAAISPSWHFTGMRERAITVICTARHSCRWW